ncbi:MAG: hypothetical protein M3R17_18055 [Bacteroidota bacterium]|nr:hypothetical protein [Bacteroidota bacterium]
MRKSIVPLAVALIFLGCSNAQTENKTGNDSLTDSVKHSDSTTTNVPEFQSGNSDSLDAKGIEFGFCNTQGNKVLLLADSLPKNSGFSVIDADREISVLMAFRKKQIATSEDNGRQTEYNFENCDGYLFEIKGRPADSKNSVVFLSPEFLTGRTYFKVTDVASKQLPAEIRSRVEADKNRKIKNFRCLTSIDKNRSVYIFEFEAKKDSALAALAYITPDKIVYENFPAKYDETSTWRVDDGGQFGVEYFELLAVFEKDGRIELVTDWPGAEGYATSYLRENGATFKELKSCSRYTAPL